MRNWIKNLLGISALETLLNKKTEEVDKLQKLYEEEIKLKAVILKHLERLNDEFLVAADINPPQYAPSVILIIPRKGLKEIKEYYFKGDTLEEVYEIIEGFGRRTGGAGLDIPKHLYYPRFKYE